MDERKVHIDEFFNRQMGNHSETPPPAVWDTLEKRLDEQAGRKRPVAIWWFWGIAGLILISATVIMAGYLYNSSEMATGSQPAGSGKTATKVIAANNDVREHPASPAPEEPRKSVSEYNAPQESSSTQTNTNTKKTNAYSETNTNSTSNQNEQHTAPAGNGNSIVTYNIPNQDNSPGNSMKMPGQPKPQDVLTLLHPQTMAGITTSPTRPVLQPVGIPLVAATLPRDSNTTDKQKKKNTNRITVPELVASSIHPSPADVFAKDRPQVIPGTDVAIEKAPELSPEVITEQYAYTDTTKKKKIKLVDTGTTVTDAVAVPIDTREKVPLPLEFGIKAGYGLGFNQNWRANKWAIAPYLEYRLPSNFSIILQPTVHLGNAKTGTFANSQHSYHEITSSSFDSTSRLARGAVDSSVLTGNPPDTIFRTYSYGQVYDSIHVGYGVTSRQMWDIEVPLMVKYKVSKTFAFILGGSVTYSSVLQTKEEMTRYEGLVNRHVDAIAPETFYTTVQGQPAPAGPAPKSFGDLFKYNTDPYTGYTPRAESNNRNFFRYGFMLGASATLNERWMIDVMLHKTGVDATSVPDKELQKLYNQPYLRLMVGYKLK